MSVRRQPNPSIRQSMSRVILVGVFRMKKFHRSQVAINQSDMYMGTQSTSTLGKRITEWKAKHDTRISCIEWLISSTTFCCTVGSSSTMSWMKAERTRKLPYSKVFRTSMIFSVYSVDQMGVPTFLLILTIFLFNKEVACNTRYCRGCFLFNRRSQSFFNYPWTCLGSGGARALENLV